MFSRKQYIANECTHSEYYGQFVTQGHIYKVVDTFGAKRLLQSKDEHLNDIPLSRWDNLCIGVSAAALKECGESMSLGTKNCILKEAARQFIESQKQEQK